MGFFNLFSRKQTVVKKQESTAPKEDKVVAVGAKDDMDEHIQGFNNSNITFSGDLKGFDYADI